VPYPGCRAFLQELQSVATVTAVPSKGGGSSGGDGGGGGEGGTSANVADHSALHEATFLTARPPCLRRSTQRALAGAGIARCALVVGSACALGRHGAMLAHKYARYEEVRALYAEARIVFLGDNGQADALLGERILESDEGLRAAGAPPPCVLIHDVLPSLLARDDVGHKTHRVCERGTLSFRTYAGAAHAARLAGLLSADGLERVAFAVAEEIRSVPFGSERARQSQQTAVLKDVSVVMQDMPSETALRCMEAIQLM
jgi:hypothetical protein